MTTDDDILARMKKLRPGSQAMYQGEGARTPGGSIIKQGSVSFAGDRGTGRISLNLPDEKIRYDLTFPQFWRLVREAMDIAGWAVQDRGMLAEREKGE